MDQILDLMAPELEVRIDVNVDRGRQIRTSTRHEHESSSTSSIGGAGRYRKICEEVVAEGYKGFRFQAKPAELPRRRAI